MKPIPAQPNIVREGASRIKNPLCVDFRKVVIHFLWPCALRHPMLLSPNLLPPGALQVHLLLHIRWHQHPLLPILHIMHNGFHSPPSQASLIILPFRPHTHNLRNPVITFFNHPHHPARNPLPTTL